MRAYRLAVRLGPAKLAERLVGLSSPPAKIDRSEESGLALKGGSAGPFVIISGMLYIEYDDITSSLSMGNTSNMMIFALITRKSHGYDTEWEDRVKGLLKAELKRRNVGYRDLAEDSRRWVSLRQSATLPTRLAGKGSRRCLWCSALLRSTHTSFD